MVKEDRILWEAFLNRKVKNEINRPQIELIARLHSELFNHEYNEPCTCSGKIYSQWIADINKVYESK
tara:strand:+ start:91 stop:291 length:201 start_codon:yes stop_codon:yes gene_type:complete